MDEVYNQCAKPAIFDELYQGLQPFVYWHVTESVQEGYNPDAIGALQEEVEVEALVLERRSLARDRALGLFISLLHHYLIRQSDTANVEAAIAALGADLDKEKPVSSFSEFRLDTAEIHEYIEEQKQNAGLIADDPDWHQCDKISAKLQWNIIFRNSLNLTRDAYVEACKRFEHRFDLGSQADLALVKLLSTTDLVRLASQYKANPQQVVAPPSNTVGSENKTSDFWSKRIGGDKGTATTLLPKFDPAHLIRAGQQFRATCLDHVRAKQQASAALASAPGKDVSHILSQASNTDTDPERLIERAGQLWTLSSTAPSCEPTADDAATVRSAKDLLSSALRILGSRDGTRNISLRVEALNLRGHLNRRIATLKPQHERNYLERAVADWSASAELDSGQKNIIELLAQTEIELESRAEPNAASGAEKEVSSTDGAVFKQPTKTDSGKQSASQLQSAATAAGSSDITQAEPDSKARDKTVLESPFFRADLVTGLMVDSLLNLSFPHRALRETLRFPTAASVAASSQDHVTMLDRLAKSHQQTTKALTAENRTQIQAAIKAVSMAVALPDLQVARDEAASKVLRRTSLRLVLGTLYLLQNEFVKAQTELELVSNALKPSARSYGKSKLHIEAGAEASTADNGIGEADQLATLHMQTRVQGQTLLLLAKTCWLTNKVQESIKFYRWFLKWYSEQQAERVAGRSDEEEEEAVEIELEPVDMAWWDKVVVVTRG